MIMNLEKILKFLIENLQEGKDFVIEKAPETVQQLVAYNIASHTMWLCFGGLLWLAAFGVFCVYGYKLLRYGPSRSEALGIVMYGRDNHDCIYALVPVFAGFVTLIITFATLSHVDALMQWYLAPNVQVLQHLGAI